MSSAEQNTNYSGPLNVLHYYEVIQGSLHMGFNAGVSVLFKLSSYISDVRFLSKFQLHKQFVPAQIALYHTVKIYY